MKTADAPADLQVKELAEVLGVSCRYVYEMRRLGFVMRGDRYHGKGATAEEARQWIISHGFRMASGYGIFFSAK